MISGKVVLVYGHEEFVIKKGQTFYIKGDRSHSIKNLWDTEAKVIWVSNPPSF